MVYIICLEPPCSCKTCCHYRYDEGGYKACWASFDEANEQHTTYEFIGEYIDNPEDAVAVIEED